MAALREIEAPPVVSEAPATGLTVLRNRQFRWLYISNIAFFFAMNGQFIVRSILAYDITNHDPFALGLINLVVAVPCCWCRRSVASSPTGSKSDG
jgi:hypothetical protein